MTAKRIVAWILVVLWAVVIFWASAHSGLDLDAGTGPLSIAKRWLADVLSAALERPVDPSPIGHFGEYLVFGLLLVNALRLSVAPPRDISSQDDRLAPLQGTRVRDDRLAPSQGVRSRDDRLVLSRVSWGAIAIAGVYAATDEFHQLFVPGRACDPVDWLIDMAAVALVVLVFAVTSTRRE